MASYLNVLSVLEVLRMGRRKLLCDFYNMEPSIGIPMFRYEHSEQLMNFSIESYFISWMNFHYICFEKQFGFSVQEKNDLFFEKMNSLLKAHMAGKRLDSLNDSNFVNEMLEEKRAFLLQLMRMGDVSQGKLNQLIQFYERDKALLERKMTQLREESQ